MTAHKFSEFLLVVLVLVVFVAIVFLAVIFVTVFFVVVVFVEVVFVVVVFVVVVFVVVVFVGTLIPNFRNTAFNLRSPFLFLLKYYIPNPQKQFPHALLLQKNIY